MQVRVSTIASPPEEMRSLWAWLDSDHRIRRAARMRWADTPTRGEMGGAFEAILLVLGTGLSAAQLVTAIGAWRASRVKPSSDVILEVNGLRVAVSSSDPEQLAGIAAALAAAEASPGGPIGDRG